MKTYLLQICSYNVTTSIRVDLTPKEKELIDAISTSVTEQRGQNNIYLKEIPG